MLNVVDTVNDPNSEFKFLEKLRFFENKAGGVDGRIVAAILTSGYFITKAIAESNITKNSD